MDPEKYLLIELAPFTVPPDFGDVPFFLPTCNQADDQNCGENVGECKKLLSLVHKHQQGVLLHA
jgi:hypothetical protein